MLRILHIADYCANYPGNFIPSLTSLYQKVRAEGNEMIFIFPVSSRPDYNKWMNKYKAGKDIRFLDFQSKNLAEQISDIIRKGNIDIVHTSFFPASKMMKIHRLCGKRRYFFHIHSNPLHGKLLSLKRIRNWLLFQKDIKVIACSPYIAQACKRLYPRNPVFMVQNGIDPSRLAEKTKQPVLKPVRFLMFGYNVEIKGVDLAVEAFLQIPPERATLDIVVAAHWDSVQKTLSNRFGTLPPSIRLISPESNVNLLYHSHDAFISASRTEGLSYALIEAYYSGLPVISSDIPQSKDIGLPGVLFFQSGNANDLQKTIQEMLDSIDVFHNDANYVLDHCSIEHWSDGVLSLYNNKQTVL